MELEEIALTLDELEAIRLADYEGRYHEDAAQEMKVSRATFGRIVNDARRKIAEALTKGKALRIETKEDNPGAYTSGNEPPLGKPGGIESKETA